MFDEASLLRNHTAAQHKYCKSLSPDQKTQVNTKNAAEHKKHQESLSSGQKGQTKSVDAVAHKKNMSCSPRRKKHDSWKQRLNNVMNI